MNQQEAMSFFMPQIEANGKVYEKCVTVLARPAVPGERIDTFTSDGKETTRVAAEDEMVIENNTEAREQYIIDGPKFRSRYEVLGDMSVGGWMTWKAKGVIEAFEYQGEETKFVATWGEDMVLKPGDMVATPLPEKKEVYRIARKEFGETYRLK